MRHTPFRYGAMLLAALFLLVSCTSAPAPTVQKTATPTPAATSPLESATMPAVKLTPAAKLLAPAPQHCPASQRLSSKVFPAGWGGYTINTTMPGHTPVWEDGINPNYAAALDQQGYTPWPGLKILWEVGPDYTALSPVTVRVSNLSGGKPAWWSMDEGGPPPAHASQTMALNTVQGGYHGSPVQGWQEWGSVLYIFQAGCYALDVTWSGGHWRLIFAAGR